MPDEARLNFPLNHRKVGRVGPLFYNTLLPMLSFHFLCCYFLELLVPPEYGTQWGIGWFSARFKDESQFS